MLKVEITDPAVNVRSGTGPRGAWQSREQTAWVFLFERNGNPQPHPQRMILRLDESQQGYPVGKYELDPSSFYLGDFGRLNVFARLKPVVAAANRSAA